jgi:putative phage-type endonuclease
MAIKVQVLATREAWLAERMRSIGASESAAAIQVSPWMSDRTLYELKTGGVKPANLDDNEAVYWGNKLEAPIREAVSERLHAIVKHDDQYAIIRNAEYPFMHATLDGYIEEPSSPECRELLDTTGHIVPYEGDTLAASTGPCTVQIKTASAWTRGEWSADWPMHYRIQCQHELIVSGYSWGILAVLIGGQELRMFPFVRDEEFCSALVRALELFWQRVIERDPPEPDGSASTIDTLSRLYPEDDGETIHLPADSLLWDQQRQEGLAEKKAATAKIDDATAKLKDCIGDAACGIVPNGIEYTWKTQHRAAHLVKASTSRVIRRRKAKGDG